MTSSLRRSAADRKVAGVCAGLAQHWGIDPLVVRLGCVLLALSGGVGIVLYLVGWLLMVPEGRSEPAVLDALGGQPRSWPRELRIVLVVVGCVVVLGAVNNLTPFGFGPAVVVALVWYFGYHKNRPAGRSWRASPPTDPRGAGDPNHAPGVGALSSGPPLPSPWSPAPVASPFTQAVAAWQQRVAEVRSLADQPPVAAPYPPYPSSLTTVAPPGADLGTPVEPRTFDPRPSPASVVRRPSRAHSPSARRLRLVALAVLVVTQLGVSAVDRWARPVPLSGYLATALLVLGATLVVAAWLGRARGILPVALLVMLATVASTVAGPVAQSYGWETERLAYTSASQLTGGDQRRVGQLRVDLSQLTLDQDASYRAHVGNGAVVVTVPQNVDVVLNWRVGAGAFVVDGEPSQGGPDLHGVERFARRASRPTDRIAVGKTVVIDVSVDRGVVEVRR